MYFDVFFLYHLKVGSRPVGFKSLDCIRIRGEISGSAALVNVDLRAGSVEGTFLLVDGQAGGLAGPGPAAQRFVQQTQVQNQDHRGYVLKQRSL